MPEPQGFLLPQSIVEKGKVMHSFFLKDYISTEVFFFSTVSCEKESQCWEVILDFISLTISAKEGSFFIFCSTCRMEWMTVE